MKIQGSFNQKGDPPANKTHFFHANRAGVLRTYYTVHLYTKCGYSGWFQLCFQHANISFQARHFIYIHSAVMARHVQNSN